MTATITAGERLESARDDAMELDRSTRPVWPGLAVVGGLLMVAAASILFSELGASGARAARQPEASTAAFPTVGTSTSRYLPGHSSGWHVHSGLHSVVVLSGTLTVYDENCVPTDYGEGQTYLGGSTPHVARNETSDVLDVAITYVYRSATEDHGRTVAPPAECELS